MNFYEMSLWLEVEKELSLFEAGIPAPPPPPVVKKRVEQPEFNPGFQPSQDQTALRDKQSMKALGYIMKTLKAQKPVLFDIGMRALQGKQGRDAYMAARQAVMSVNPQIWTDIVDMKGVKGPTPPPVPGSRADFYNKMKHPAMKAPPPPPQPRPRA